MADTRPERSRGALRLARDVLDKEVLDPEKCKVGKVDGIVIALRAHRPPRVIALELNQATAWRRVHPRLGDLVEWIQRTLQPEAHGPARIAFEHVVRTGIDVHIDMDWTRTRALAFDWPRYHTALIHLVRDLVGSESGPGRRAARPRAFAPSGARAE